MQCAPSTTGRSPIRFAIAFAERADTRQRFARSA
jgi:hypothetical protein